MRQVGVSPPARHMPGSQKRPTTSRLLRVGHVDHRENVVGEIGKMDRGIGVTPAGVPDAVRSEAIDRHEADLGRLLRPGDIVDADAGGEPALVLQLVRRRAAEIGLLVLEFLHGPDARRVDGQQQIVMGLQVEGARSRRTGDEVDGLRVLGIAHVDGGDAVAEAVADIGVAAMHHDLDAVTAAAHVGMTDELDIAGGNRIHVTCSLAPLGASRFRAARFPPRYACVDSSPPPRNNCPMRGSARMFSARSAMRVRPSSSTMP